MALKGKSLLQSATVALTLAVALPGAAVLTPTAAAAASTLPAPYLSRALDAVLMPVDASVVSAFGLAAGTKGVLVLATQPDGLADSAGIEPGDVIDFVGDKAIASPIELDEIVYYWILNGVFDFDFGGYRGGNAVTTTTTITLEYWEETVDITTVSTWSSYSYESFSYEEYYSEYSEEITASYEESETTIEETVTSEEFTSEVSSEEEVSEDATTEEEATAEEDAAEDDAAADCDGEVVDGECQSADDAAAEDEGGDDMAADEAGDEDAADDAGEDDAAADEDAGDDGADEGGDEGGDDGGDDVEE